jgi:hypothetical protein
VVAEAENPLDEAAEGRMEPAADVLAEGIIDDAPLELGDDPGAGDAGGEGAEVPDGDGADDDTSVALGVALPEAATDGPILPTVEGPMEEPPGPLEDPGVDPAVDPGEPPGGGSAPTRQQAITKASTISLTPIGYCETVIESWKLRRSSAYIDATTNKAVTDARVPAVYNYNAQTKRPKIPNVLLIPK